MTTTTPDTPPDTVPGTPGSSPPPVPGPIRASAEELAEFGTGVREALADLSGPEQVRSRLFAGPEADSRVWSVLAGQLDLPGLMVPEAHGGSGLGVTAMRVAFEEAGAALLGGPLLPTAGLAVPLLLALGEAALTHRGREIAEGRTATVALVEDGGGWDPDGVRARAIRLDDGGWAVTGEKDLVLDGAAASLLLVVARDPDGHVAVVAVDAGAPGVTATPLVTLDHTRAMARLTLDGAPGVRLDGGDAGEALAAAADVSRVLLAAEQLGGAQRCLDSTVAYAKDRLQFGRPIGSFQAVKQRLADALGHVEYARSAVYAAAETADAGGRAGSALRRDGRVAALLAGETFTATAAEAIQLHGGLGFTWEHDAHLYYKRARTDALLLGSPSEHVAALAAVLETEID